MRGVEAVDRPGDGGGMLFGPDEPVAVRLGEHLRRLTLGLTVALAASRWYWPGEAAAQGDGLVWTLAILLTLALGLAASWLAGGLRGRLSLADAAVLGLALVTGLAARDAPDRRAAINIAWQSGGVALAYLLLRCLPAPGRRESQTVAGVLLATVFALAVYGLYQIAFEDVWLRALYESNPASARRMAGVSDDPVSVALFHQRVMESKEPRSTFALTNSLAGVLVGPLLLGIGAVLEAALRRRHRPPANLATPGDRRPPLQPRPASWGAIAAAVVALAVILGCLLLTKSRSAAIGFVVGLAVLALRLLPRVRTRTLAAALAGIVAVAALLFYVGLRTRQLDPQVWSEAPRSLQVRWEYWVGSWHMLTERPGTFWTGVGPGSFGGAYLRHKLPTSSEEIADPHNLILETWANAGVPAVVLLLTALGVGFWQTLAPRRASTANATEPDLALEPGSDREAEPGGVEAGVGPDWGLWAWGLASLVVGPLVGGLNPLSEEADGLGRWLVLFVAWVVGAGLILPLWSRVRIPAAAAGAGALAVAVNLLAAGGIGMPTVALALWGLLALGLNVRLDRPCASVRWIRDRLAPFVVAFALVALVGTFAGAVVPAWQSGSATAAALAAQRGPSPRVSESRTWLIEAARLDPLDPKPWLLLADLEARAWVADPEATPPRNVWEKVRTSFDQALTPPRNPRSLRALRQRADLARWLLDQPRIVAEPSLRQEIRADLARTSAAAVAIYPTSATLRAQHAEAAAGVGRFDIAVAEAREALRLHETTPHRDKKIPEPLLQRLRQSLPGWEAGQVIRAGRSEAARGGAIGGSHSIEPSEALMRLVRPIGPAAASGRSG